MPSNPKEICNNDPNVKLGADGKPIPLTEIEQVQLQIENAASEVRKFRINQAISLNFGF